MPYSRADPDSDSISQYTDDMSEQTTAPKQDSGSETALADRPGFLIRRLHQIHVALFLEECAEFNLTPVQYAVLTTLLNRPDLDQISIANEAGIDRTSVADVLARLEDRGLLHRRRGDRDKRMRIAALTEEGTRVTRTMEQAMMRAQEKLVAPLPPEDRETLMRLLSRLVEANNEFSRAPARPVEV